MNFKHLVHRFWYLTWFVLLPLAIASTVVAILDRLDVIEEVEVWYVLLLFAVLAFAIYAIRDHLPFWQDRDPESEFNRRRRRREARQLRRNVYQVLAKKGERISERGKGELEKALSRLTQALEADDSQQLVDAMHKLEERTDQHLAFVRKSAGREYFESIGVAVLIALVLRLFVVEAFKIPSESMVPTLMVGDHIFVSKYRYGLSVPFSNKRLVRFAKPAHGEVVVFLKPSLEEQLGIPASGKPFFDDEYEMVGLDFIKRIVGLPGDTVEMRDDVLFVNGRAIPRCRVGTQTYRTLNRLHGTWEDHQAELWVERHGDHRYTVIEEQRGPKNDFGPRKVQDGQVFVLGDNRDNSNDSRYWGAVPFDNIKGRAMFIWWSNRRPHGFQWDRVGQMIMNEPKLDVAARAALANCPDMR